MKFIMNSTPKTVNIDSKVIEELERKVESNIPLSTDEIKLFLDNICYLTRCKFTNDFDNYDFSFKCDKAVSIITHYLNDLGVETHPCSTQSEITTDIEGHSFLVARFNVMGMLVPYLIDPTYRQFFTDDKKDYLTHNGMILKTPSPGHFIKDEDKPLVERLLIDGYHILDENTARIYGDSFYNTKTGYTTKDFKSINGNIYINSFTKGHAPLSKTKEELESEDLLIKPQNQKTL